MIVSQFAQQVAIAASHDVIDLSGALKTQNKMEVIRETVLSLQNKVQSSVSYIIDLSNNMLFDGDVDIICYLIENLPIKQIEHLKLSNNHITGIGLKVLINSFVSKQLDFTGGLMLKGNAVSGEGLIVLAQFLQHTNLQELDLSWNSIMEDDLVHFIQNINGDSSLQRLYLAGNKITDKVGLAIDNILDNNKSLSWICLEYNSMKADLLQKINNRLKKFGDLSLLSEYASLDNLSTYKIASTNDLMGGLYNKCYQMKDLYVNERGNRSLLELDINDYKWSYHDHPLIQLFLGDIWRAILGSYSPNIVTVISNNGKVGVSSAIIEGFTSILNDENFNKCFPLCERIQFVNLDLILSFAIISGNHDIHFDNIGINRQISTNNINFPLYKVDHDSLTFFSVEDQMNLCDLMIRFMEKKYLYEAYKPLFAKQHIFETLITGFQKISQLSEWDSLINGQLDLIKEVLKQISTNYIIDKVFHNVEKHANYLQEIHKHLPEFLEVLAIQNCAENAKCEGLILNDYDKKYEFILLDQKSCSQHTPCEYTQLYDNGNNVSYLTLCKASSVNDEF